MESTPRRCIGETAPRTRKFFGSPAFKGIQTMDELIKALRNFCETAGHDEILNARQELRQLAAHNHEVYNAVNAVLWTIEFPLETRAWENHYLLLNAGL